MVRVRRVAIATLAAAALLPTGGAGAAETDQFLTWDVELCDSADRVNQIVNDEIEAALRKINRKRWRRLECKDLPPKLFRRIHPSYFRPRLRTLLREDPEVEFYPDEDVGYWEYLRSSIYRKPHFPWFLPMARSIRIGDVHIGVDKLGHLFNTSRCYYKKYRKSRRKGLSEQAALRRAVLRGARREKSVLGGTTDGVVSHADLEANYQGLRLALDLCEADPPYLERTAEGWRLSRPVDLRNYITPSLDESYNGNYFVLGRWKKTQPLLIEEYCPLYYSARVQRRLRRYRQLDEPSPSQKILEGYFSEEDREGRAGQAIPTVCAEAESAARGGPDY